MALTVLCHWQDEDNHLLVGGHMHQWAMTKQKVCGTVLGDGGEPRGHERFVFRCSFYILPAQ